MILLQNLNTGTDGASAQNRTGLTALSAHPTSTTSPSSERRGLSCDLTPWSPYLNQSPLLPVFGSFSTVQFVVHFWELVLEIPDLSLVLFPFHLYLEQPDRRRSSSEKLSWALSIVSQSDFRLSGGQAESSKEPLPFSAPTQYCGPKESANYDPWGNLAQSLFL